MNWDDYEAIGDALAESFPLKNHMTLSNGALIALIAGLDGFDGGPTPPDDAALAAIRMAWVAAATEDPETVGP